MNTITRKQREIQERGQLILDTARPMLIADGYHGLSMDRIAESLEYSKGTIYNHFSCKEEIIIALVISSLQRKTELFERAAAADLLPRERMLAVGVAAELFSRLFPDHQTVEQIIRPSSILSKTSEERQIEMRECEMRCIRVLSDIVRDAVERRDVALPEGSTPEELVFGLWSLTFGAYGIIATHSHLAELGIADGFVSVRVIQTRLLDGYDWQPVSGKHDYEAVEKWIRQELFPNEFQSAFSQ